MSVGRFAVEREYERRLRVLFRFAIANGLATADDVFARAASQGRFSADELVARVVGLRGAGRDAELGELVRGFGVEAFQLLILLRASQLGRAGGVVEAAALLEAWVDHAGPGVMRRVDRMTLLDLLSSLGRGDALEHYLGVFGVERGADPQVVMLRANVVHPFVTGREDRGSPGVAAWLELVGRMYLREGLEPFDVAPGDEAPLDRLVCAPSSVVEGGPLVTVIIPTFNPQPRLRTALESLICQSYRSLEILVMDDASPAGVAAGLDWWEERDPRIKVVHLPRNRGPYFARNVALERFAHGDYVTVHDDDDWSHPRKIEVQVARLEAEREVPANMSRSVRTTPDLRLYRRGYEPEFAQDNYSSLMIRRGVLDGLGYWDVVNRAADGEMRDRIVAAHGVVPVVGQAPLSWMRAWPESISHSEISRGYIDPRRRWYGMAYRSWHERAREQGSVAWLPPDDSGSRPFPVPVDLQGSRASREAARVDVLYVTDYRFAGGNSVLACNEIEILLGAGLRVGMLQLDSPVRRAWAPLHPRAFDLALHPNACVLSVLDEAVARLTIVRHPTVLQFVEPVRAPITTGEVVVIVNHPPVNPDGQTALYDIEACVANCEAVFGRTPVVAPESGVTRGLLDGLLDPGLVAPRDWNGVVGPGSGRARQADPSRPPIIGRHSRDHLDKWPLAEVLPLVYPTDRSRDVRVLGGAGFAEKRLGRPVGDAWTVYPFGSKPVGEFLAEVDFWVYFYGPDWYESFGMAAAEAMAAGLVVILPRSMEVTFGDGAVYCEPGQALRTVDRYWADPAAYAAQSARAIQVARERFGENILLDRVNHYLHSMSTEQGR